MAKIETTQPGVATQEGALIGDENLPEARVPQADVVNDTVPAQVSPPRAADVSEVVRHETHIAVDEVITDPSDPRAVQVPDAGRGDLSLPIHQLAEPTPEAVFASAPKK